MWMKSVLATGVLVSVVALGTACGSGAAPASQATPPKAATGAASQVQPVTLTFASQDPGPQSAQPKAFVYFAQQVEKQTKGKVKVKIYWGGSLVGGGSALTGVQNDTADSAQVIAPYFPGQLPLWSVANAVPFAGLTPPQALKVARGMLSQVPALRQELGKFNQVLVGLTLTPAYGVWSKNPVRNLHDLAGLKVRTNGAWMPKVFSAVGAEPVSLRGPEMYTALQRGTINAAYFPISFGELFKLDEIAKHFTTIGLSAHALATALITVNKGVWEKKLTAQERKIIMKVGYETGTYNVGQLKLQQKQELAVLKQQHVIYSSLPKSAVQKWASLPAVTALRGEWVKSVNAKGLPGTKTMKTFLKLAGSH